MPEFAESLFIDRVRYVRGFEKLILPDTRQSIMLIRARKDMGKTWLTLRMQWHCRNPAVNLPVAEINFRSPYDRGKISDYLSVLRLARDRLEAPAYFALLNERINRATERPRNLADVSAQVAFAQQIEVRFNLEELEEFTNSINVIWDNIPGNVLEKKALELVLYCQEKQLIPVMLAKLSETRPNLNWQQQWSLVESVSTPPTKTEVSPAASVGGDKASDAPLADLYRPLPALEKKEREAVERMLTDAFFEGVASLVAAAGRVVFLFDGYEEAPDEARRLLRQELVVHLHEERLHKMVIIVTGRETPDLTDQEVKDFMVSLEPVTLEPFAKEDVVAFLQSRNMREDLSEQTVASAFKWSGGVPGELDGMVDQALAVAAKNDDFFKDL